MKILVSANDPTRYSAPNIWALRVLPQLKQHGINAEIVFFHYEGDSFPVYDEACSLGLKCHLLRFNHTEVNVCELVDLVRSRQPDIFVPNVNVASYYACRWIRQAGVSTVGVLRSDDPFYHDLITEFIGGHSVWKVDAAVSVSEHLDQLVSKAGPESFAHMACPSGTPVPAGITTGAGEQLVITYSGRMVREQKRMDEVIPALAEILKKNPDYSAVFQGEGEMREPGLELIRKAGLQDRFKLPGFTPTERIHEQLLQSHVFLMLSDYEGLSTALLEAMACGVVPIVKRMDSGISEVVTDGETGLVIDDRNNDLEEALKRLRSEPGLWKRLSGNARKLVETNYATQVCARRWHDFLQDIRTKVDFEKLPRIAPDSIMLPRKTAASRGIAIEDHRIPTEASELSVLLVRSHEYNYSETFIEDHVRYLSNKLDVLYGFPFPRILKGRGSVLEPQLEPEIAKSGPVNTGPLWDTYVRQLASFLKKSSYQVVLAESGLMGSYVSKACQLAGVPCVIHFHGADAFVKPLIGDWIEHYRESFKSASRIVVVSKAMQSQLHHLGAPPKKVALSPYGVEVQVDATADPKSAPPHFLAVGRFTEKKAPQLTLDAFKIALEKVPDLKLTMVGDGELLADCQKWVEENGISESVHFAGVCSRDEVSRLMSQSRAFVQHSVHATNGDCEGLPLAILEAGAHGLPVISTRHAGIPDAIESGKHGLLGGEGDIKSMADAMIRLGRDNEAAAAMGAAFRERVCEKYSREISLKRLQGILLEASKDKNLASAINGFGALRDEAIAEDIHREIGLDRNNGPAYLKYGEVLVRKGLYEDAYLVLKEAQRVGGLPDSGIGILNQMEENPELDTEVIRAYRDRIDFKGYGSTEKPMRILVVTNLLPPQEMGGYGRTVWEFCDGLMQRGHTVKVLTADVPSLYKKPEPGYERVEQHVKRSLSLFGHWKNGGAEAIKDEQKIRKIILNNARLVAREARKFKPQVCMTGNLDFLGSTYLDALLEMKIPVLHRLGNKLPGYPADATPRSPRYAVAGCSNWVNESLRQEKYPIKNFFTLAPGSPLQDYYRLFPPRFDQLRICYAGLIMAYKGPHVLVRALGLLKNIGIPFTCELAGDFKDPHYKAKLENLIRSEDLEHSIKFLGFCNRGQLSAMYARSNVMVVPSVFEEPFGKSRVEGQAAGLAVVTSDTGGYQDIHTDGVNSLVFRNEDPEDLAKQLYMLQADPEFWQRIASQGQQDAFRFTTRRSVESLEQMLGQMAAGTVS